MIGDAGEPTLLERAPRLLAGVGAITAAAMGLMWPGLGGGPAGAAAVTVAAGAGLVSIDLVRHGPRTGFVATGLVAYLAYAEAVETMDHGIGGLFLLHLGVFMVAVCALLAAVTTAPVTTMSLSAPVRIAAVLGALLAPALLVAVRMTAVATTGPASAVPVSILDLGLVSPAFLVAAVQLLRRRGGSGSFTGPLFVLGAALLLSVAGSAPSASVADGFLLPAAVSAAGLGVLAALVLLVVRPDASGGADQAVDRFDLAA